MNKYLLLDEKEYVNIIGKVFDIFNLKEFPDYIFNEKKWICHFMGSTGEIFDASNFIGFKNIIEKSGDKYFFIIPLETLEQSYDKYYKSIEAAKLSKLKIDFAMVFKVPTNISYADYKTLVSESCFSSVHTCLFGISRSWVIYKDVNLSFSLIALEESFSSDVEFSPFMLEDMLNSEAIINEMKFYYKKEYKEEKIKIFKENW